MKWIRAHNKAIGGAISVAVTTTGALVAEHFLPTSVADTVARAVLAAGPILTFLGIKIAPANQG